MNVLPEMLLRLTDYFQKNEEKFAENDTKNLEIALQYFIKLCAVSDSDPPLNIPDMIQRLYLPASEWGIRNIEEYYPLDACLLDQEMGLSIAAEEFAYTFKNIFELEQLPMKKILYYCRKHQLQEDYVQIRTFLSNPKHAVISRLDLQHLLYGISDGQLAEVVESCYEKVPSLEQFRICPNCCWTLQNKNGVWTCNRGSYCHLISEFYSFERFPSSNHIFLRMTRGIHRFTLLPGIAENRIQQNLESEGYWTEMYPEIDEFDILVKKNGRSLKIDVKDHYYPLYFAQHICKQIEKDPQKMDICYVVPEARLKVFQAYIEQAKQYTKRKLNKDIQIVSEKELYSNVEDLLV